MLLVCSLQLPFSHPVAVRSPDFRVTFMLETAVDPVYEHGVNHCFPASYLKRTLTSRMLKSVDHRQLIGKD